MALARTTWQRIESRLRSFRTEQPPPDVAAVERELQRLSALPQREKCLSTLLGVPMEVNDPPSFAYMYDQTFRKGTLAFQSQRPDPFIIDCGANVGVTVHYWKHLFPESQVVAFEPDPTIFPLLKRNCAILSGVELHDWAVWTVADTLEFFSNGSVGGRLAHLSGMGARLQSFSVPAVRLRQYLDRPVEMLKMDIEGAEAEVLVDCADRLHNVRQLFVEYHSFSDRPQHVGDFLNLLERAGFRLHIHSELPASRPFMERPIINGKDLRLNIFASRAVP